MSSEKIISGLSSAVAVTVQPIELLRFTENEDGVIRFVSDSNLLMNAERIRNTIGEENYLNIVRSISPSNSPYKQRYSDAELIRYMKSRYLQSPAEVAAWIQTLNDSYEELVSEAQAVQAAKAAESVESAGSSEALKTE